MTTIKISQLPALNIANDSIEFLINDAGISKKVTRRSILTGFASSNITTEGLYEHSHTITSDYTIAVGNNAIAAGPLNIASGSSITIPTGSTLVIA